MRRGGGEGGGGKGSHPDNCPRLRTIGPAEHQKCCQATWTSTRTCSHNANPAEQASSPECKSTTAKQSGVAPCPPGARSAPPTSGRQAAAAMNGPSKQRWYVRPVLDHPALHRSLSALAVFSATVRIRSSMWYKSLAQHQHHGWLGKPPHYCYNERSSTSHGPSSSQPSLSRS